MESKDFEKLEKSLKFTRTCCIISSFITFLLLIAFIVLLSKINPVLDFVDTLGPVVDNVAGIDVQSANGALEIFNREAVKIDWAELSEIINELDVDAINEAVRKLDVDSLNETLSSIDVEALNASLKNLNEAAETLKKIGTIFR
ncbi:MAG: hypothetical protein IKR68_00405 [Lachnospiraceae bacterium]|nr:hypothetical protein [Lachnospiraceae bacterium]